MTKPVTDLTPEFRAKLIKVLEYVGNPGPHPMNKLGVVRDFAEEYGLEVKLPEWTLAY